MAEDTNKKNNPSGSETLSVYGYTDFRLYLKDFYDHKKASHKGYSYRAFSKAAGFGSPNFLKLVIEGQRNISPDASQKFVKALGLVGKMAEYFLCLVQMNQAKDDQEKEGFFHQLKKLAPHAYKRELDADSLQYLSHWIYPVLRDMVAVEGFHDDPYWLMRRIHGDLSHQDVSAALQFLIKSGFIIKGENGRWSASDKVVISSDEVKSLAVRNYHRQMLERARQSLERLTVTEREFGALTFVMPEHRLDELKQRLKSFRSELHEWAVQAAEQDPGELVIQVNFQMYPQTKKVS